MNTKSLIMTCSGRIMGDGFYSNGAAQSRWEDGHSYTKVNTAGKPVKSIYKLVG